MVISGRLDDARSELLVRISVAQVGLIGDLHAGFSVAVNVLMGTNSKRKRVLGEDLLLARKLRGRQPDGNRINLNPEDMQALGLETEALRDRTPDTKRDPVEVSFVENVTLDQARIMFGIVGVQDWQRAAGVKANVRGNQFGNEMKFFAGIADASVAQAVFAK
ncbi:uncharacterized protein KD926_000699 [Aspergillus affinis]|uniref:uncharacterized protein n=1 Tax=Aspergillus affinis TaxID=1070780 RepID=UPI0022FE58F7|nr:uncharacterized protein KD926_000699 [Aspergillus affinis]KAI9037262.1 hypothetical protein KD926_000699 [Aspergillus affinis]